MIAPTLLPRFTTPGSGVASAGATGTGDLFTSLFAGLTAPAATAYAVSGLAATLPAAIAGQPAPPIAAGTSLGQGVAVPGMIVPPAVTDAAAVVPVVPLTTSPPSPVTTVAPPLAAVAIPTTAKMILAIAALPPATPGMPTVAAPAVPTKALPAAPDDADADPDVDDDDASPVATVVAAIAQPDPTMMPPPPAVVASSPPPSPAASPAPTVDAPPITLYGAATASSVDPSTRSMPTPVVDAPTTLPGSLPVPSTTTVPVPVASMIAGPTAVTSPTLVAAAQLPPLAVMPSIVAGDDRAPAGDTAVAPTAVASPPPPAQAAPIAAASLAIAALPAQTLVGTAAPARQLFAAAIEAAVRQDRDAATPVDAAAGAVAAAPLAPPLHAVAAAGSAGGQQSLDMRRDDWPSAMVDHIERLRDAADAADTRIRLVPDALGGVDVAISRRSDGIHVALHADQAATQTLLADARPQLAELAGARGLKLADAGAGANTGGNASAFAGQQRQPAPRAMPAAPVSPGSTDDTDPADGRIA